MSRQRSIILIVFITELLFSNTCSMPFLDHDNQPPSKVSGRQNAA